MATKGASGRYEACMFVVSSLRENKALVAAKFRALAERRHGPGAPVPDIEGYLTYMADELERLGKAVLASDQAYLDEISDDPKYREIRDEARHALAGKYRRQRDVFTATFGEAGALGVGFEPRIERRADRLVFQVQRILEALAAGYEPPASDMSGVAIDLETFARGFDPEYTRLGEAEKDLLRELREADTKLIAKRAAVAAFDPWLLATTRSAVAHYVLVGMDEEARRIRPSRRRPGHRAAVVEGEKEPTIEPATKPSVTGSPAAGPAASEAPATDPDPASPAASSGGPEQAT